MASCASFSASLLSETPMISAAASSSSCSMGAGFDDDTLEDACSICLDPFTTQDPATVTNCKHEYHLQCILEWSQRSKECPICWQILVLKDPASQELLAAVETERRLRSRNTNPTASTVVPHFHEDYDVEQDSYSDDSDFDEHIMQRLTSASRTCYVHRRERQRSSGLGPSQVLVFTSPEHLPAIQQTINPPEGGHALNYGSSDVNPPTPAAPSVANLQFYSSVSPPVVNEVSSTAVNTISPFKSRIHFRQPTTDATQGPSSPEMFSLSDSIKSKWFAASARYKESLSKSTRGIKEKLLARNNSVKELSKEVQKEMSAGIAGVARMIERLDLTSKRTVDSISDSGFTGGTSNFSFKGKGVEQNVIAQALAKTNEEIAGSVTLDASSYASATVPGRVEVSHVQRDH